MPGDFAALIETRARALGAGSNRPANSVGIALTPLERRIDDAGLHYRWVDVTIEPSERTATLLGVNPSSVYLQIFFISGALAGAAGVLIGLMFNSVHFLMGEPYLLRAFVVVVLGGLGSPVGAVVAGLLLGLIQTLTVVYLSSGLSDAIIFAILFGVLLIKPTGLFAGLRRDARVGRT